MTEKQYKELLQTLGINATKSNVQIKELLEAKLNEYLDRTDAEAEQMVSDIQDALDYVEDLIEKMGGGIALAPEDGGKNTKTDEESQKVLVQAAKKNKKEAVTYTSSAASGQNANAGTSATQGVNPKGKAWYYSLYGDQKVDAMFEMAEGDLKQGDFQHAKIVFDMILQIEVTNPGAYLGKVLAEHKLNSPKNLATCRDAGLENDPDLKRAISSANPAQKKFIQDALEERRLAEEYLNALGIFKGAFKTKKIRDFQGAESLFMVLGDYRDAKEKVEDCRKEIERLRKEEEERARQEEIRRKVEESKRLEAEKRKKKQEEIIAALEKKRAEEKRKKIIRNSIIGGSIAIVLSIFMYFRYMSPTYYGTNIYMGAWFYDEFTIADSVRKIAPGVFKKAKMTSIVIPDSVIQIDSEAFMGCTSLETVKISENVQSIGSEAFAGCSSLKKVQLPDSLESIGESAFSGCVSLKEAVFGKGPQLAEHCGEYIFADCIRLEKLTLPVSVEGEIPLSILYNCSSMAVSDIPLTYFWEEYPDDYSDVQLSEKFNLFAGPVENAPMVENETQFWNMLVNTHSYFIEPGDTYPEGYYLATKGIISNLVIGEEKKDESGREIAFSFDYQKDIRFMNIKGVFRKKVGIVNLDTEFVCENCEVNTEQLLQQSEDGNYPLMQKLLDEKFFPIDEVYVPLIGNNLFIKEASISESAQDITGVPVYTIAFKADYRRDLKEYEITGYITGEAGELDRAEICGETI